MQEAPGTGTRRSLRPVGAWLGRRYRLEPMTADPFASRLFAGVDDASRRIDQVVGGDVVAIVQPAVRAALTSCRDDGSWPETSLLQEVLAAYVDLVDAALIDRGSRPSDLDLAGQRWLDAFRRSAESFSVLDAMLADLRPDIGVGGFSTGSRPGT
jgi:hypothetical protein